VINHTQIDLDVKIQMKLRAPIKKKRTL